MKKSNKEEPKDTKSKALLKANEFIYSELNGMDRYISLNDNRYTVTYGTADQEMHRHFPFENTEKEIDSNVLECEYLTQKDYVVTMSHTTDGWTLGLPAYHVTRSSDLKCTVQADTLREAMKKLKLLQKEFDMLIRPLKVDKPEYDCNTSCIGWWQLQVALGALDD